MTPRHASSSRVLQARIASRAATAANWAYRGLLTAWAAFTLVYTVYVLTSRGPS